MNDVVFDHIGKAFSGKTVLRDFSETIHMGQCVQLKGPSGCGKTTLLRLAAGLIAPDTGKITRCEGMISYVFQEDRLIEFLPALKNLHLVCKTQSQRERAEELLARLGLSPSDKKPVGEYSGGMKRRVAIARAVVVEPKMLLLDEPFTGLDEANCDIAARLLSEGKNNRITLLVSHDEEDTVRMRVDRIVKMG